MERNTVRGNEILSKRNDTSREHNLFRGKKYYLEEQNNIPQKTISIFNISIPISTKEILFWDKE